MFWWDALLMCFGAQSIKQAQRCRGLPGGFMCVCVTYLKQGVKRVLSAQMIVRIRELNFLRFGGASSAACVAASASLEIPPSAFCRLLITWSADAPGSGGTMLQDCHYEGTCSVVPSDKGLSERICSYSASVHFR